MDEMNAAKQKIVSILDAFFYECDAGLAMYFTDDECEVLADYLIENGVGLSDKIAYNNVIILPCDIGDTIYEAIFTKDGTGSHICERICSGVHVSDKVTRWMSEKPVRYFIFKVEGGHSIRIRMDELGKTLFLTREEAEAALRKGRKE